MSQVLERDWFGILGDDSTWPSDDDVELLEYVERWEAQQPAQAAGHHLKPVNSSGRVVKSTLPEYQKEASDTFVYYTEYGVSGISISRRRKMCLRELGEMCARRKSVHKPSTQFRYCKKFYARVQLHGYLPRSLYTRPTSYVSTLAINFPVRDYWDLLAVLGFTSELSLTPEQARKMRDLEFRGIPYSDEVKQCMEMRDDALKAIYARRAVKMAAKIMNEAQDSVDALCLRTQRSMHEAEQARYAEEIERRRQQAEAEQKAREAEARRREELRRQELLEERRQAEELRRKQEIAEARRQAEQRAAWEKQQAEARRAEELRQAQELREAERRTRVKVQRLRSESGVMANVYVYHQPQTTARNKTSASCASGTYKYKRPEVQPTARTTTARNQPPRQAVTDAINESCQTGFLDSLFDRLGNMFEKIGQLFHRNLGD